MSHEKLQTMIMQDFGGYTRCIMGFEKIVYKIIILYFMLTFG